MCYRTTCPTCQKATWGGCGAHVESALRGVPPADRCTCREAPKKAAAQPQPPPAQVRRFWPFG